MVNTQPTLPSPSNLLLVPLAGPNQKSGRKGNPNWCSPYRSISQGENRVDSEGQIRQLAQLMRANVAECKMATNSSIPECVFVVGLCSSSSQQVRPVSPPLNLVLAITSVTQIKAWKTPVLWGFPSLAVLGTLGQCVDVPKPACWRKRDPMEEKQSAKPTGCQLVVMLLMKHQPSHWLTKTLDRAPPRSAE